MSPSGHDQKVFDWDIKHKLEARRNIQSLYSLQNFQYMFFKIFSICFSYLQCFASDRIKDYTIIME